MFVLIAGHLQIKILLLVNRQNVAMTHIKWNGTNPFVTILNFLSSLFKKRYPFYYQLEKMDCGPTCLKMVAAFYGRIYSLHHLRMVCHISRTGITLQGLVHGAKQIGFQALPVKLPFTSSDNNGLVDIPLPAIAFWGKNHFVVINKISTNSISISDPGQGQITISHKRFIANWAGQEDQEGVVMLLQPTEVFFTKTIQKDSNEVNSFRFIGNYLNRYKKYILLLAITLVLVSLTQYVFPFLTRSVIDIGIKDKKIRFIYFILAIQLLLYTCQTGLTFLQNRIVLHLSARINILLSSDFLSKLTRLPISFYDNQTFGEIIQRINDHRRVESFLSASTLSIVFSIFSMLVYGIVLFSYNHVIFIIFFTGTLLYLIWILVFLSRRKKIDYEVFNEMSANNEILYEFVYGMQEIKLQNSQKKRSIAWTLAQERLFKINLRSAALNQMQDGGAFFINQFKDIIITIFVCLLVIQGKMSIGMLLATQLMVGLLNAPVQQLVIFIRNAFDIKLCLDRITEIHQKEEEIQLDKNQDSDSRVGHFDIQITNLSFKYNELERDILKNITFSIPKGKLTAIVGSSGSGKTTLIKLLLGFYSPNAGSIELGLHNLSSFPADQWRNSCGAVLQDGYIFSDSILNNVGESDEVIDGLQVDRALQVANINEFVNSLALGQQTMIGSKGQGLSQGQKQRILIARAVYKNPDYLFFDEATNALDTKNERIIMNNLEEFYKGKTVVVVAHRLSTVRNADHIIVLEEGCISESGTHAELIEERGVYFNLIKNQLELAS
jgi:ATP-binding cassette subfamily B protein